MQVTGEITLKHYKPNSTRIEWEINDFCNKSDTFIRSEDFKVFKSMWYLEIIKQSIPMNLDSSNVSSSKEYLCMAIRPTYQLDQVYANYKMGIVKRDGETIQTKIFQRVLLSKCSEHKRLISTDNLRRFEYILLPGKTLNVFCNVFYLDPSAESTPASELASVKRENSQGFSSGTKKIKVENSTEFGMTGDLTSEVAKALPSTSNISTFPEKLKAGCQAKSTSRDRSKYSFYSKEYSTLSENFKDLYRSQRDADVTIEVKGNAFPAHKLILSARSRVFASMLSLNSSKKNKKSVEIRDCDPNTFEDFLLYIYTGTFDTVSSSNALSLFETALKFELEELQEECIQCMIRGIDVNKFCDIFDLAKIHGKSDLLLAATTFFMSNAESILESEKWPKLLKKYPKLCNDLYRKRLKGNNINKMLQT